MTLRSIAFASLALLAACATPRPEGGAAPADHPFAEFGVEVQAYPAGVIPGLHVRRRVSAADALTLRLAANITDRGDWGEHDDETGDGFGGGVGWRRAHSGDLDSDGLWYGVRLDLWDLEIDWEAPWPRTGTTDVLVLQPTAEVGYGWSSERWGRIELGAGLGAEINVDTDGEDVGEGAIFLLGVTWLP